MIAVQSPLQLGFHPSPLSRCSIDISSNASISPRTAFMSRENTISGVEFGLRSGIGRGAGGWVPFGVVPKQTQEKDGSGQSGIPNVASSTSRTPTGSLHPSPIISAPLQSFKVDATSNLNLNLLATPSALPQDAFESRSDVVVEPKSSIIPSPIPIPIFDAKTSTTSRVIRTNSASGRSKKPISARNSRNAGMPWVHTSPPDLWQVVQPSASSSKHHHHHNFTTQPSAHPYTQHPPTSGSGFTRRHVGGGAGEVTLDSMLRAPQPIARPVPKAIGSERKQRQQPTSKVSPPPVPATLDWNPTMTPPPPSSSSNSWTTSVIPSSIPIPFENEPKRFGPGPQISILVPEKQKQMRVTPLPTPPPTPPALTPSLTIVELTPAPIPESHYQQLTATARKHALVTKFNAHRTRWGGPKHTPRFSSPLNPAMSELGLVFQDCLDVEKKERELNSSGPGRREKSWNYFRKPQIVGSRNRTICERWNPSGGGSGSISSYLRGGEQKHCIGCRREGLRVRLMVVGVWRWGVLFGESPGFDDDDDDDDDDDILSLGSIDKTGRFVMDYWDDDEDLSGSGTGHGKGGMLMRRDLGRTGDVPMDVDHDTDSDTDSVLDAGSLEAELKRASEMKMEVDSTSTSSPRKAVTEWVGGVPGSPRLKDLDDFDEI